jgi:hypothetical protein
VQKERVEIQILLALKGILPPVLPVAHLTREDKDLSFVRWSFAAALYT